VVGNYVNDSEGIAVEWDNKEDAERIAQLFQLMGAFTKLLICKC